MIFLLLRANSMAEDCTRTSSSCTWFSLMWSPKIAEGLMIFFLAFARPFCRKIEFWKFG